MFNVRTFQTNKLVLMVSIVLLIFSQPTKAVVKEAASISAGVDLLSDEIDSKINSATAAGEYLIAISAMRAASLLDLWKETNVDLLDEAFGGINESLQNSLLEIEGVVLQFDGITEKRVAEIQASMDQISSTIENVNILGKGRSFILRHEPQIIPPNIGDKFRLIIKGVNLSDASFEVDLPGDLHEVKTGSEQKIEVIIDSTLIERDDNKSKTFDFDVTYDTKSDWTILRWFGVTKKATRTISLIMLPNFIGEYVVKTRHDSKDKKIETYTSNVGQFDGRHTTRKKVARPKNGYYWDIDNRNKFKVKHDGGDGGYCHPTSRNNPIWNESTKDGVVITARLDDRDRGLNRRDGKAWCSLIGPVYKQVDKVTHTESSGKLTWLDDIKIDVSGSSSSEITIKTFDGRTLIGPVPMINKFFKIRELNKDEIVLHPIAPELSWKF